MRGFRRGQVAVVLALTGALGAATASTASGVPRTSAATQGKTGTGTVQAAGDWRERDASTRASVASVLGSGSRVASANPDAVIAVVNGADGPQLQRHVVANRAAAATLIGQLQRDPKVLSIAVDVKRKVIDMRVAVSRLASNDALWKNAWDMQALGVENVWAQGVTGTGVTVAVIDSGVDGTVPDLKGQVLQGTDLVAGGNGWKDGVGHGTHVAGTVAALANNGIGSAGMAPGAKILPVRVADSTGWARDSATTAGIIYAVNKGAKVLNLSLGGDSYTAPLAKAVQYARSKGALVVAASGNERQAGNPAQYPGAFPGVVAVAATGQNKVSASFSNYGSYVAVAAPGVDIPSTIPGGQYALGDGTSMAAPHVSGLAALMMQASGRKVSADRLAAVIMGTTTDVQGAGFDVYTGYGLINPSAAVDRSRCVADGSCTVPYRNVAANPTQRYVQRAYLTLAARQPSSAELLAGGSLVVAKKSGVLTNRLVLSGGYQLTTAKSLWASAAGTPLSSANANAWAKSLPKTGQAKTYANMLANSAVYAKAGGTNDKWLRYLYTNVMGIAPDNAGLAYWTKQLAARKSRATVALAFVNSTPTLTRVVNQRAQRYLGHDAGAATVNAWVPKLRKGTGWQTLDAAYVGGSEFQSKS